MANSERSYDAVLARQDRVDGVLSTVVPLPGALGAHVMTGVLALPDAFETVFDKEPLEGVLD